MDVYKTGKRLNNSDPFMQYWYRPIVCIKTPVFEEKYEATLESNYYIGEAINAEKYGQKVNGYTSQDTATQEEAGAWRLFYQNKAYTYLISDKGIRKPGDKSLQSLYTEAGYDTKNGADVSIIGQGLNPMFKEKGGFTSDNTNLNIKATAYLTDPEQWTQYKGPDATFAIGGPSEELIIKSFNATSARENRGVELEASIYSERGYWWNYQLENYFKTEYNITWEIAMHGGLVHLEE